MAYPAAILFEIVWIPIAIFITIVAILFRDQWKQLGKIVLLKLVDIAVAIGGRIVPLIFRFLPFFFCNAESFCDV